MKLRILSLAMTTGAIFALLAVFWVQSDTLFGERLKVMRQIETESLHSFVKTLLDAKSFTLQAHRRRWEKDSALAKAALFERGLEPFERMIQKEENFDLVEVVKVSHVSTSFGIEIRNGEPWLVSRSPVRLFDETVGRLLLAYRLNGNLAQEVTRATNSRVKFAKADKSKPDLVYSAFPLSLNAQTSSLQSTTQSLRGSMLWMGSLCLLLIALLALVQKRLDVRSRTEAVGKIAAQVAHDLRSPLAALEIAVQTNDSKDLIQMTLDRIRKIIRDLDEKKPPSKLIVELGPLTKTIIEEKKSQYREKIDVEIHSHLKPDLCASIDPVEFQRILSNLIDNSVQALSKGGHVEVSLTNGGSAARVQVKDDGIGIPHSILPRLFKRGASFGKENGNGLGLWHARRMAERWGGSLQLTTEINRGTEVVLEVPLA